MILKTEIYKRGSERSITVIKFITIIFIVHYHTIVTIKNSNKP